MPDEKQRFFVDAIVNHRVAKDGTFEYRVKLEKGKKLTWTCWSIDEQSQPWRLMPACTGKATPESGWFWTNNRTGARGTNDHLRQPAMQSLSVNSKTHLDAMPKKKTTVGRVSDGRFRRFFCHASTRGEASAFYCSSRF
jgi:hypothetical protein